MKATMKCVLAVAALGFASASFACHTKCCATTDKHLGINTAVYVGDTLRGNPVVCSEDGAVSSHRVLYYKANTTDVWKNCGCADLCD
jgi:hypothetical protein